MKYDFTGTQDTSDFVNLDPGWYTVSVQEVRESSTRDGDTRWGMLLRVVEGEFSGRFAAWDGLVWSDRGAPRAKTVLGALGFDASGSVELVPADLIGRQADVELLPEEYEHPVTGRRQRRNRVSYEGFAAPGSMCSAGLQPVPATDSSQAVDSWGAGGESCAHENATEGTESQPF
ncbi:MAG: hypothetical protein ABGY71_09140 [bacterium]|nr:hypothetical protein [Planctomycetota bacterium]HIL52718.1 hypothetical protein [Planctomycetota bacterium]